MMRNNCVIVGNGLSLKDSGLGKLIDSFDHVVRLNNYRVEGFEKDVGYRRDILFRCGLIRNKDIPNLQDDHSVFNEVIFLNPLKYPDTKNPELSSYKNLVTIRDQEHEQYAFNIGCELDTKKGTGPTVGSVAIQWALTQFQEVYVVGFDCLEGGTTSEYGHYYSDKIYDQSDRPHHDFTREVEAFKALVRESKIRVLNLPPIVSDRYSSLVSQGGEGVSVIMGAAKTPEYIGEMIESFRKQENKTNTPHELIIGVDRCYKTWDALKAIDLPSNVRIYWFPINKGPYLIFNSLVDIAKYSFVTFFGADDMFLPNYIDQLSENKNKATIIRQKYNKEDTGACGAFGIHIKDFKELFGGFRPWRCEADREFGKRAIALKASKYIIEEPVFIYRQHDKQTTKQEETNLTSSLRASYRATFEKGITETKIERVTTEYCLYPTEKRITLATVLVEKPGGEYTAEWADKIHQDLDKYVDVPHKIVCLTNVPEKIKHADAIPLEHEWEGWWAKMELFKLKPPVFYIDLDMVILSNLDQVVSSISGFQAMLDCSPSLAEQRTVMSCVMGWDKNMRFLYDTFKEDPAKYMAEYAKGTDKMVGDQGFIGDRIKPDAFYQELYPDKFISFKRDYLPSDNKEELLRKALVLVYHGQPRPWSEEGKVDLPEEENLWVVVGSGPSKDKWKDYCGASIITCNAAVNIVNNPDIVLASDPDAIKRYGDKAKEKNRDGSEVFLGAEQVQKNLPTYDMKIRTIIVHGIRHALHKGATKVILCGGDGWPPSEYKYTTLRGQARDRKGSNENQAWNIFVLRKLYPKALIEFVEPCEVERLVNEYEYMYSGNYCADIIKEEPIYIEEPIKAPIKVPVPITPREGAMLIVGSGPSLIKVQEDVRSSPITKLCINNSIQLINNPDMWYAGDLWNGDTFPSWIWGHTCEKFVPNYNNSFVRAYPLRRRRAFKQSIDKLEEPFYLQNILQEYNRETFLQGGPLQIGFAWKKNKEILFGQEKIRSITSSFLAAFLIAIQRNVKDIYLVGVDLETGKGDFYAHGSANISRTREQHRFEFIKAVLKEQAPVLKDMGVNIWNCNPNGGANMFPYKDFR